LIKNLSAKKKKMSLNCLCEKYRADWIHFANQHKSSFEPTLILPLIHLSTCIEKGEQRISPPPVTTSTGEGCEPRQPRIICYCFCHCFCVCLNNNNNNNTSELKYPMFHAYIKDKTTIIYVLNNLSLVKKKIINIEKYQNNIELKKTSRPFIQFRRDICIPRIQLGMTAHLPYLVEPGDKMFFWHGERQNNPAVDFYHIVYDKPNPVTTTNN
jgi:hypothetical protein